MSQRELSRSGAAPPADLAQATPNGHAATALPWEAILPALSSTQRQALLDLDCRKATATNHVHRTDRSQFFFNRLLHGPASDLPPLVLHDLEWFDAGLDADQRSAVALALQTPDVAVIQGQTGTGKSRLIEEIIRQEVKHGQRVLFVSPTRAALDVVLERLEKSACGLLLRCLAPDERAERLLPAGRNCTWPAYERQVREDAVQQAARRCRELEQRLARLQGDEPILNELGELARSLAQLQDQINDGEGRHAAIPAEVHHAASAEADCEGTDPFLCAIITLRRESERRLGELNLSAVRLNEQRAKVQAEIHRLDQNLKELAPLADAQEHSHWFSLTWWKQRSQAKKLGDVPAKMREKQELLQSARLELEELNRQQAALEQEQQRQQQEWQRECEQRITDEIQRRQQIWTDEKAPLLRDQAALEERWEKRKHDLSHEAPQLQFCTVSAHELCRNELQTRVAETRSQFEYFCHLREFLPRYAGQILARLREAIQVVAMPLSACADDKAMREVGGDHPFDLLIVDDAHHLAEADLLSIARFASRWVLVGEPVGSSASENAGQRRSAASRGRHGASTRSIPLPRLTQSLLWPIWRLEGQRLCCRMLPLSADERRRLEVEPVADSPEIELHILCPEQAEPKLAEVTFPAAFSLEHAKLFLFRELQEVPVPARLPRWEETGNQIRLIWSEETAGRKVEYAPGVVEHFSDRVPGRTIAISFNCAAGWDRARAEQWLQRHTRRMDTGRAVTLHRWHRPTPALAGLLAEFGIVESPVGIRPEQKNLATVEFIPVPGFNSDNAQRRRGEHIHNCQPRRLPVMRGGAGLELDLADPKHRDRLPPELRSTLPPRGYVNLAEAQAILRLLDDKLEDWARNAEGLHIAILALYRAQAELLRHMLRSEAITVPESIRLTVEFAGDFHQQECDLAILSLTRSHERRAVTFGDDPALLRLAVTRSRQRILFVGDPGTLSRRSQWEGPLDHLDEALAQREKTWVTALVKNLQGGGPAAILLHEGPP
ncbi:MAG TPA: AAA domain-containing protein [Gemmataceae bacterium]|nr:AAA domain-containing protein [Gemmataceae bacterium]